MFDLIIEYIISNNIWITAENNIKPSSAIIYLFPPIFFILLIADIFRLSLFFSRKIPLDNLGNLS